MQQKTSSSSEGTGLQAGIEVSIWLGRIMVDLKLTGLFSIL